MKIGFCIGLLILLFLFIPDAKCQNKKAFSAEITVVVKDTALLKHTTLNFQVQLKGINTDYGFNKIIALQLVDRVSKIRLPLAKARNYVRIIQLQDGQNNSDRVFNYASNLYIVEAGDKIELHLAKNIKDVVFKGKNAAKYNCAFEMGNHNVYNADIFNRYAAQGNFVKAFEHSVFQHDSIFKLQTKILTKYKEKISDVVYHLMYLDLLSFDEQRIAELCIVPFQTNQIQQFQAAKAIFRSRFRDMHRLDMVNRNTAIESYYFCDFLIKREKASFIINKSTASYNYLRKQNFADLDSAINKDYLRGQLKDKLMLIAFISVSRKVQADYIYFIDRAIKNSLKDKFSKEIKDFKERNSIGHTTFNFALPDTSGNIHQLTDYKGKLVVIDFWFTGCHGCLLMAPIMKTLADHYKSNPNIVFLTISVDRNKNLWKSSILKKIYSGDDEINLLAENGEQSQIVQYFNIQGYPTLIVFGKDGTLVSAAPPDPRDNLNQFNNFLKSHL